jgi:hypothetical protein
MLDGRARRPGRPAPRTQDHRHGVVEKDHPKESTPGPPKIEKLAVKIFRCDADVVEDIARLLLRRDARLCGQIAGAEDVDFAVVE